MSDSDTKWTRTSQQNWEYGLGITVGSDTKWSRTSQQNWEYGQWVSIGSASTAFHEKTC